MGGCEETPLLEIVGPATNATCHVLICAGHALSTSVTESICLVEIGRTLEIGRGIVVNSVPRLGTDDPHMSRTHARIKCMDGERLTICDLGSRNGTFLDGVRVNGEAPLRDGGILFAGAHVFVYRRMRREELAAIEAGFSRPFGPVPTTSPLMARLVTRLRRLANSSVEILLTGETGVGKEVMAEAIHRESGRPGAFVAINCAALPEGLVESELFGYAQGAHSTAVLKKSGLIEKAKGGTLYLDEIGEMSSNAQANLLRFLQGGQYHALGATRVSESEVRVVAATGSSVAADEDGHGLRIDLAARLGPEPVRIPPLRARPEDIGLLVQHFLRGQPTPFDNHAYRALFLNPWRGNVRELEKTVHMASVLSTGPGSIGLDMMRTTALFSERAKSPIPKDPTVQLSRPTPPELSALLERHRGNVGKLAREIGRQRTLVWRWLRIAGLEPAQYRDRTDDLN
jgi:transcriptional regulator with PAS, ATPase and Fis domain